MTKIKTGWNRRQILRALGVGGAVAPFIPALDGWAAPAVAPRRLLLVFSSGGMVPENFWPHADGAGEGPLDTREFTIAPESSLAPMVPHQKDLVIVNNVGRKLQGVGGAHERAMGGLWTGCSLNRGDQFGGGGWPSGPSVDQLIARGLPHKSDFSSLEIGVQPFGPGAAGGTMQHMCYAGSNQPVPPEGNPYKLFDRLFGGAPPGSGVSPDQIRAERRSVIDLVKQEIADASSRVGKDDRQKIEAHLEGTRSIERRLQVVTPKSCLIPLPSGKIDLDANENFPALIKLQTDLLVSAFACDRTRVASLQWSRSFSMVRHTWLENNEGHHTLSHDPGQKPILTAINRWYMEHLAYLVGALGRVPEGGGRVLDNTLLVYCNELHTGWDHKPGPAPIVLAGQLGGTLKTGRYVDFGKDSTWNQNNLLVSLCHVMGLSKIDSVGNLPTPNKGPLPTLFG
jgi:hypothetical protein